MTVGAGVEAVLEETGGERWLPVGALGLGLRLSPALPHLVLTAGSQAAVVSQPHFVGEKTKP